MTDRSRSWAYRACCVFVALLSVGCAGASRSCSSNIAEEFGGDWVVVQTDLSGKPFRCWELKGVSIANEPQSDGIYWKSEPSGNLVHLSGLYNRVQVVGGDWPSAFAEVGLTKETCMQIHRRSFDPGKNEFVD